MSNHVDFKRRCLVVITGASKGIGRQIALEISKRSGSNLTLVLIARSLDGLQETQAAVLKINPNVNVKTHTNDLSEPNLETYERLFETLTDDVDFAMIYHNAGSLGKLDKVITLNDLQTWRRFFDLNLFSTALLNSAFVNKFKQRCKKTVVINISSLCGSQPFKSMGMYGTGKAARNLYFKVMAVEEEDVLVLNYSPGPVDTDMVSEVIDKTTSSDIKSMFVGLKEGKTILTADVTVNKMLDVLEKGDFKSGDLIDYYDRV